MPDPDLEIRGGGGVVSQKFFSALRGSVGLKIREVGVGGGGAGGRPSPGSATERVTIVVFKNL